MSRVPNKSYERLRQFADRDWYPRIVAGLAAIDQFIVILPIEGLMIPSVLARPARWIRASLWVASGSALGSLALASVADRYGQELITEWLPSVVASPHWASTLAFIEAYGPWALFLVSVGPFPQQPAVVLAGLSHMPPAWVFAAVLFARTIKYCFFNYLASHAPALLERLKLLPKKP